MITMQECLTPNRYQGLIEGTTRRANAAVVVFSSYRAGSLDAANELIEAIKRVRPDKGGDAIPVALVAYRTIGDRVVTADEIEALRQSESYDIFTECCATPDEPAVIEKVFLDLIRLALSRPVKEQPQQGEHQPKREESSPGEQATVRGRRKRLSRKIKSIFSV